MKKNDWLRERKQWFKDNPRDYYSCHYCGVSMMPAQTTLDHSNNRKHKGVLVPCCYFDNYRKGSISHDRYVQRYYPAHQCKEKPMTLTAKDSLGIAYEFNLFDMLGSLESDPTYFHVRGVEARLLCGTVEIKEEDNGER